MGAIVGYDAIACYVAYPANHELAAEKREIEEDHAIWGPHAERVLEPEGTKKRLGYLEDQRKASEGTSESNPIDLPTTADLLALGPNASTSKVSRHHQRNCATGNARDGPTPTKECYCTILEGIPYPNHTRAILDTRSLC